MIVARKKRIAVWCASGAIGIWGWSFLSGGVVPHPPAKPDRPVRRESADRARAAPARTSDTRSSRDPSGASVGPTRPAPRAVREPRARVAALEERLEALEGRETTRGASAHAGLDLLLQEWSTARGAAEVPVAMCAELERFLADHPLAGTLVRSGVRIATFGVDVVCESDTLVPGRVSVERIEPGAVVLDCDGMRIRLEVGPRERADKPSATASGFPIASGAPGPAVPPTTFSPPAEEPR